MDTVRGTIIDPLSGFRLGADTDPYEYRWVGEATQALVRGIPARFDTALITRVTDNLHVGGCIGGMRLPDDVDLVVSLYPWEQYIIGPNTRRIEWRAYDATDHELAWAEEAAAKVVEAIEAGERVLVHCQAGINRSSLVAAIAMVKLGWVDTGAEAISLLREKRSPVCLCNEAFENYLGGL